ncbi:MAG TPA: hypothetical protein DCP26_04565 [Brevundimonas sp.]|nr:hypothetical protein [Brevundimonas sp.]
MLEKTFEPKAAEPRIYAQWEESGLFAPRAAKPTDGAADAYSIVIPPPNVTGSLHIGHALNNTLQDILARYHRMKGKAVLWLPGTDHAGIATQMVVERKLAAEGKVSDLTASGERLRLSATPLAKVMAVLGERGSVQDDAVMAAVPRAEAPALLRALIEKGVDIDEARWVGADLESVFMTETSSVEGGRP